MSWMYDETSHFRKRAKPYLECCDSDYFYSDRLLLLCYCKFRITALTVTVYNGVVYVVNHF